MKNKMLNINLKDSESLRYERKFVIVEWDKHEIEHFIKHNPAMFSEIFRKRNVNNIYLDSRNHKNYEENVSGNAQRLKVRIRWYGKVFGIIANPVLELKIKNNELGKKLSFPLKPFIFDENFSLNLLQKIFSKSNLPEWLIEKLKLYHPTLLNSYKRKYFSSANKKYRITLDWDLVFFKIGNRNNFFNERLINQETCILEAKYSLKNHEKITDVTKYFPFRLEAHSKYVYGINLLNIW